MTPSAILHIGPGAFHRAHQAVYAAALIDAGHPEARIREVCLFPPRIGHSLDVQKGAYHVLFRDAAGQELRRITSIGEVLDKPHEDFLSDPALRLVTMTLTEKGYCHLPGTRKLDPSAIASDLEDPLQPRTGIGWLALGLARRQKAGLPGLTLASCDNIPANGRLLQAVLSEFVDQAWPALASWMARNVSFPVSMVDRIVPRVDDEASETISQLAGERDMLGVAAEPFGQWVLENDFALPIPPLDKVGVQIVEDVRPYELMKHRILNGAQTAIAHLGALSGFETSCQAANDPVMGSWLARFCAAQARTLTCPPGENLDAYVRTTLERLRNPHIRHSLVQIGTDSSFKMGQRIVEAAVHHVDGPEAELYALTIAAWLQYNTGRNADGAVIPVSDPLADRFRMIVANADGNARALVEGFMELDLFEGRLRHHRDFKERLVTLYSMLERQSPRDLMMATETSKPEEER
ncbi:mannitol dehydrogenase family protein [Paracoccus aerodenitrificans]|uniref:mannitol dehydrogenase family protein n=1 Tax=Paracoccus aerodenitrificans TaxID=3017781 RepID=UPI0022F053A1|nr:mannitol dehydrogenase family protein [Paracoccus aerodenitrificans]WBU62462.1 mannitol dehydrogenase family protein [Paracoccus aerodenitrificans]